MPRNNPADPESDAIIDNTRGIDWSQNPVLIDNRKIEDYWPSLRDPNGPDRYLPYYVAIAQTLKQGPANQSLRQAVRDLETDVIRILRARVRDQQATWSLSALKQAITDRTYRHHVLAEALLSAEPAPPSDIIDRYRTYLKKGRLRRWLATKPDRPVPVMVGFQSSGQFLAFVRNGFHFKDPLVPATHGEYSHQIQWYLLTRVWGQIKTSVTTAGGPDASPGDVYKNIANYPPKMNGAVEIGLTGLWDALVDRIRYTEEDYSFLSANGKRDDADWRSPDALNAWLMSSPNAAVDCPIVSEILNLKYAVRDALQRSRTPSPDETSALFLGRFGKSIEYEDEENDFRDRIQYLLEKYYESKALKDLKNKQQLWLAEVAATGRIDKVLSPP